MTDDTLAPRHELVAALFEVLAAHADYDKRLRNDIGDSEQAWEEVRDAYNLEENSGVFNRTLHPKSAYDAPDGEELDINYDLTERQ